MIQAVFRRSRDGFCGVEISGHAEFAESGQDIVCASVTSALQLTVNGITEVLLVPAQVVVEENRITLKLEEFHTVASQFLAALHLHLELLAQEYTENLQLTILEV